MAAVVVSGLLSLIVSQTHHNALQALFVLSSDPLFSETGAISKIKYHDRFTRYKKFIVKNLNTPRMKELFAQFNAELFPTDLPDRPPSRSSTREQETDEDEAAFSRAFKDNNVQGTPYLSL